MQPKAKTDPMEIWRFRRGKILNQLDEKMIPIGQIHELPTIETDNEESPFDGLNNEEQCKLLFDAFKACCLGQYDTRLFPIWDAKKADHIKFKVPKNMNPEVKQYLQKLTGMLRSIIMSRIRCSELLRNQVCGLVVRSIAEVIRDFLQYDWPRILDDILMKANNTFQRIPAASQTIQTDLDILATTLTRIHKAELIGGVAITYLNRSEIHQLSDSLSFIPSLFQKCIDAGMKHYNMFLEEFLYRGNTSNDRQHEFVIWDIQKSNVFKASELVRDVDQNLAFDQRFIYIPELLPSVWKPKMIKTAFHTRRLISILVKETNKPFNLPHMDLAPLTPEKQLEIIKSDCELVGAALLNEINRVFNVKEFYSLLYEMIFNSSSLWVAEFVDDVEDLASNLQLDDSYLDPFNRLFLGHFYHRITKVKDDFPLVSIALFENGLFDKKSPSDIRLLDLLESVTMHDDTADEGDHYGNDENQPINYPLEDYDPNIAKVSQPVEEPAVSELSEDAPISVIQKIGIEFSSHKLFKCLLPGSTQEHLNRLFRLKFALVRANTLLGRKRADSPDLTPAEQIFITFVQNFINRYTYFVFGMITEEQWHFFETAVPTLKSIDAITAALKLILRNINASSGLFTSKEGFSGGLQRIFDIISEYCSNEMDFNTAADLFFETYKHIRAVVCNKEDNYVEEMSYEVFRVPPLARMKDIESIEIDPRPGLAPQRNLASCNPNIRRSVSLMNVPRR